MSSSLAGFTVLLVGEDLVDGSKADKNIHNLRELWGEIAYADVLSSESYEEPVETSNDKENYRGKVK